MEHTDTLQNKLVERCRKGDKKAEFALFHQYAKQMFNVAFRITGNQFDAEDVTQDAFIKAFNKIKTFRGDSTFGAWLKRIVVNQALSLLRKQKIMFDTIDEEHLMMEADDIYITEELDIKTIMQAVNELPDGARVIFTLKAIEEYKYSEISKILNLTETNCKVQYHRSKKLLREKLKNRVFVN